MAFSMRQARTVDPLRPLACSVGRPRSTSADVAARSLCHAARRRCTVSRSSRQLDSDEASSSTTAVPPSSVASVWPALTNDTPPPLRLCRRSGRSDSPRGSGGIGSGAADAAGALLRVCACVRARACVRACVCALARMRASRTQCRRHRNVWGLPGPDKTRKCLLLQHATCDMQYTCKMHVTQMLTHGRHVQHVQRLHGNTLY